MARVDEGHEIKPPRQQFPQILCKPSLVRLPGAAILQVIRGHPGIRNAQPVDAAELFPGVVDRYDLS